MKFQLDTEDMETIKLTFSDEDLENELSENIQDFCYGMAAFFVDFAQKIGCDTKKALEMMWRRFYMQEFWMRKRRMKIMRNIKN